MVSLLSLLLMLLTVVVTLAGELDWQDNDDVVGAVDVHCDAERRRGVYSVPPVRDGRRLSTMTADAAMPSSEDDPP